MTDEQILTLFSRRDETAIREIQRQYGAYCYAVAHRILDSPEDCEECVNETWFRAWKAIPPQQPKNLKLFLAASTRNLAFDHFRRQESQRRGGGEIDAVLEELSECVAAPGSPEETVLAGDLETEINRFLAALSPRDRDVFLRRYFFTEPVGEIACRCGLRESNILVILSRTRKKLKQHLKKEGYLA